MREPNEGELRRARDIRNRKYVILKWAVNANRGDEGYWVAWDHAHDRDSALSAARYILTDYPGSHLRVVVNRLAELGGSDA